MKSTVVFLIKLQLLHHLGHRGERSATSRGATDGKESSSLSLPEGAFLQLLEDLYWQPSNSA